MRVIEDIAACRNAVVDVRRRGETVGLVPTMGALHEGHLSLIRAANARCRVTVVTIFVNPTQFGPNEDLAAYPRTLDRDLELCRREGVEMVFSPTAEVMYPDGFKTSIHVAGLTEGLCGPFRPGHFDGVATVVAKLFLAAPADQAFFGEKDYQQLQVIRRMAVDLNFPIEIVGCPTVRDVDGLALSSRNVYLSPEQRKQATSLIRALFSAQEAVAKGQTDASALRELARKVIDGAGPAEIEYIEVVDADNLRPLKQVDQPARICLAVRIGQTRLIDNVALGPIRTSV
jgi:pantoate--beta-alanine ligase